MIDPRFCSEVSHIQHRTIVNFATRNDVIPTERDGKKFGSGCLVSRTVTLPASGTARTRERGGAKNHHITLGKSEHVVRPPTTAAEIQQMLWESMADSVPRG
jgi:hypothetical protein